MSGIAELVHWTPEEHDQPACDADLAAGKSETMFGTLNPDQVTCSACMRELHWYGVTPGPAVKPTALSPCIRCNGSGSEPDSAAGQASLAEAVERGQTSWRDALSLAEEIVDRRDRDLDDLRRENEHIRAQLAAKETTP